MAQAYYNFEAKIIQRSKGQSSVAAAAYNAGEKLKDERTGTVHDYSRKQEVYQTAILTPANAPAWASDRQELWNRAEQEEKRKDSQVGRQFIMCFPTCLTHEEKIELSQAFLQEAFIDKGYAVDVAYHDFKGKNAHNPHAHVLVSSRAMTAMGFCAFKDRSWNKKEWLLELREKWATVQNQHFERTGRAERVDHRSYKDQGINRVPEIHEGKAVSAIRQKIARGDRQQTTSLIDLNNEIRQLNAQLEIEKTTLAELKAKAAQEQDNAPTPKGINPGNIPNIPDLVRGTYQAAPSQEQQFSTVAQEIVRSTKRGKPAPKPKTPPPELDVAGIVQGTQAPAPSQSRADRAVSLPPPVPATQTPSPPKRGKLPPPPSQPNEYTYRAVWKQLHAFEGDGMFEVGILDPETAKMRNLTYHRDSLLKIDPKTNKATVLGKIKAENAKGNHIFIRPAPHQNGDTQGYVLVDDIDQATAEDMREQGLAPSLIIETSWKNCQAWVKVSDRLSSEEASQVAKLITKEIGGDPGSAGYQHYGRMAGFTNRKEEHMNPYTGKYPYVMVRHAEKTAATTGALWVERARKALQEEQRRLAEAKALQARLLTSKAKDEKELDRGARMFLRYWAKATTPDPSTRDWIALKKLAKRGYSWEALEHALWHSDDLEKRKKGHVEDYIRRTLANLQNDVDVLEYLRRREDKAKGAAVKPEQPKEQDDRAIIKQWQQFHERERPSPAEPSRREQVKQPGEERKSKPSSGKGNTVRNMNIKFEDVTITTCGVLNEEQVGWLVRKTLESEASQKVFGDAANILTKDTSHWKRQAHAEYFKELARSLEVKGAQAIHPYTDAEIAIKLRMAGFGKASIEECITQNSPFVAYLPKDAPARQRYYDQAISPLVYNPKVGQRLRAWRDFRVREAIALPEHQREAYINERRLEELKLSITKERWAEQQSHHYHQDSHDPPTERER
jgi:hypothetical protein